MDISDIDTGTILIILGSLSLLVAVGRTLMSSVSVETPIATVTAEGISEFSAVAIVVGVVLLGAGIYLKKK